MRTKLSSLFTQNKVEWQGATIEDVRNVLANSNNSNRDLVSERNTPLHLAAYFGCVPATFQFLVKLYPTYVNEFNNDGRLPIMVAAAKGFPKLVNILFNIAPHTANIQSTTFGHRALEMAKLSRQHETVKLLKELMLGHNISIGVLDVYDRNNGWVDTTPEDICAILHSKYQGKLFHYPRG